MIKFDRIDAAVAHSMVDHLDHPRRRPTTPFPRYACCWMAFNNIYFVAYRDYLASGHPRPHNRPKNQLPQEKEHLDYIVTQFDDQLITRLLQSKTFQFFLNRRPEWHNGSVPDTNGVRPNGVTNIAKSIYTERPVISGIDRATYTKWIGPNRTSADGNSLAKELVFMLFTVRNNMFHGGKEMSNTNANTVLRRAYILLRMIVNSFLLR